MAGAKPITFILSDDSVNESGFRIMTNGIDISQFEKNPIMLYMHNRANDWTQPFLKPIGIWVNIRKEKGQLLADAEFDMDDENAVQIAKKVEKGHLRAASVGIKVKEVIEDVIQEGQRIISVSQSRLLEASIVDIPRNGNALRLFFEDGAKLMELSELSLDKLDNFLPFIKSKLNMKTVLSTLGLGENATELEALAAVTQLKNNAIQLEADKKTLEAKIQELEQQKAEEKCSALVDKAIADKKITAADRDNWLGLAKNSFEAAEKALNNLKGFTSLADTIESSKSDNTILNDADKYEANWRADKLAAWKKDNPEEFQRCYDAYYTTVNEKHVTKK